MPSDLVADELGELEAGQTISHAYLGVSTTESTGTAGAQVASVTAGGPAADAGLREGDIVTAIAGTKVAGAGDVVAAIADHRPGDRIKLTIRRGSDTLTLTVTLGTQPAMQSTAAGG